MPEKRPLSDARILVVDDEPEIRDVFCQILSRAGFSSYRAGTAEQALEILTRLPVDLALVDSILPGMSGQELFHRIKESYPDVAVIFISAVNEVDFAVEQLKNGAYDYLVKAIPRARLLGSVTEALRRRNMVLQAEEQGTVLMQRVAEQVQELRSKTQEVRSLYRDLGDMR